MSDTIPMTRAGYDKRKAELDHLQNVEMPEIEERIGRARAEGDLSENAEYHYARESQGLLQAKINKLRDELSRSNDPAMIAYALDNIGRGVADDAPYAARVRGLRRQLANELGRTDLAIRAKLQAGGLPADSQMVRLVRSLANSEPSGLQSALRKGAPRQRFTINH